MTNNRKVKYIMQYLSTIFSWALFCILLIVACFLLFYFVNVKIINRGEKAVPLSIYTIVSGSMIPTIDIYDVIINVKVDSPKDIEVGDIITFESTSYISAGKTVTHRVIDIQIINGKYYYTTKGDNNPVADTSSASYDNLIGKAVMRLPQLGRVQAFVGSKFGWLIVVIIPALYIILKDVAKLIKLTKIKKNADEENKRMIESQDNFENSENDDIINNKENKYGSK